jgi:small subunit ribosomal protein S8
MDPIADMLTKIRNAQAARKKTVSIPFSNLKYNIAKTLEKEEFVENVKRRGKKIKRIVVSLKYNEAGKPKINEIKRISKSGRRAYLANKNLYFPKSGYGILILSTPKGILTSKEARKMKVGGEALCKIW